MNTRIPFYNHPTPCYCPPSCIPHHNPAIMQTGYQNEGQQILHTKVYRPRLAYSKNEELLAIGGTGGFVVYYTANWNIAFISPQYTITEVDSLAFDPVLNRLAIQWTSLVRTTIEIYEYTTGSSGLEWNSILTNNISLTMSRGKTIYSLDGKYIFATNNRWTNKFDSLTGQDYPKLESEIYVYDAKSMNLQQTISVPAMNISDITVNSEGNIIIGTFGNIKYIDGITGSVGIQIYSNMNRLEFELVESMPLLLNQDVRISLAANNKGIVAALWSDLVLFEKTENGYKRSASQSFFSKIPMVISNFYTGKIAVRGTNGIYIYDFNLQPIKNIPITPRITDITFSPDGTKVAAGTEDGDVFIQDILS